MLTTNEEVDIVNFVEKMASIGHPMSLAQLWIKVAEITQEMLARLELGEMVLHPPSKPLTSCGSRIGDG